MRAELSRRLARVIHLAQADLKTRDKIVRAATEANAFDQLPAWLQKFVEEAEAAASRPAKLAKLREGIVPKVATLTLSLKHLPGRHAQSTHGRGWNSGRGHRRGPDGRFSRGGTEPSPVEAPTKREPSEEERAAIKSYMSTRYREINGPLRSGKPLADQDATSVKHLDALLDDNRTSEEMTVYRGVILVQSGRSPDVWPPEDAIGSVIEDLGFASSSPEERVARNFGGDVLFRITVPKGARALDLRGHDFGLREEEVLLPRGSRFRILGEQVESDGRRIMDLELIDG